MSGRLVVVNPNAARVRDEGDRIQLTARLRSVLGRVDGASPQVVETADPSEVRPLVEAAVVRGAPGAVGVGGDGTLRDMAAALVGTELALGVVPAGSGNQVASALGIPRSMTRSVDALDGARPRRLDLGSVTLTLADGTTASSHFVIGCGAGFDARLMATTPAGWKRRVGQLAYFGQALRLVGQLDAMPYRITIDGEVIETDATIALVGNMGQLIPGSIGPRLGLDPADGLLDLIVVAARNPVEGVRGLADQMWRTRTGGWSGSTSIRLRGRHIAIEPGRAEPLEVDGDHVGEGSLEARVEPGAIQLLVPG